MKRKSLPLAITLALITWLWNEYGTDLSASASTSTTLSSSESRPATSAAASGDRILEAAFRGRRSDLQVRGDGSVIHVLPDDNKGSRHQRFLLEIDSGLTLLVAHNIDLAPRIPGLRKGDRVSFYGEYEWTEKGGVMHWTHHDPRGRHADGWLEHKGQRYE